MTGDRTVRPVAKIAADELADVTLTVNGTAATVSVPPRMHLADLLRERLGLTGTHLGCEHGVCGMCTVLVDGDAARACLVFAVQCDGADVVTVEGLGSADDQHPLQQAFSHHHGLQCGFCTPGMLMSAYDLLTHVPDPHDDDLPEQMSGVLCRCTGYRGILAAVADVAGEYPDGVPAPRNCEPRTLVGRSGGSPRAGAAPSGGTDAGPPVPDEIRMPTGEPSATVAVHSALSCGADDVWRVLDDIDLLVRCLPGAELVESLDDGRHRGRATVALGPVTLRFDGLARIVERDPDRRRLRLLAQGVDAGGSATRAVIALRVEPGDDGSTLVADADLYLSGRIAQFGRALAGDVSRRLFSDFGRAVDEAARTGTAPALPDRSPLRTVVGAVVDGFRRVLGRRSR